MDDGVLGQFDPTLLLNDLYTIRLTVFDAGGNQTIAETTVQVDGGMKVGQFSLNFVDLQVPMAGLPLSITRTYDSRDKTAGDFGVGWKLGINTLRIRSNRILGTGWRVERQGLTFGLVPTDSHIVSLRLPDGRIEAFRLRISPDVSPLVPFPPSRLTASFVALPDTRGSLRSLDNNILSIFEPQPGDAELADDTTGRAYDPDRFLYKTPAGLEYTISRTNGLESLRDTDGNTLAITENGVIHSAGTSIQFTRDGLGRITEVADPAGNSQFYAYDANGDLRKHVDRNANAVTFDYDRKHNMIAMEGGDGVSYVRNEYDDEGRLIRTVDAEGNAVVFGHDLDARTETIIDRSGSVTEYVYDLDGNVVQRIDALGNVTEFTYDSEGNQTSRIDALGRTWLAEYDDKGRQTRYTDPLGNSISSVFDEFGRVTERTNQIGAVVRFAYDNRGNLISRIDALGNETKYAYDGQGNLIAVTDGNGVTTQYSYNSLGQLVGQTDAAGKTFSYDLNDVGEVVESQTSLVNSLGSSDVRWQYGYDPNQNQVSELLPGTAAPNTATYDSNDQLSGSSNSLGVEWSASRSPAGHIQSVASAGATVMRASYDASGRVTSLGADDYGTVDMQYDALGNEIVLQPPETDPMTRQWDALGRITVETDTKGNETRHEYDERGARTSTVRPGGERRNIAYDAAGRILRQTDTAGLDVRYEYDSADRLVAITGADGVRRVIIYDALGRTTRTDQGLGEVWDYEYDEIGLLTKATSASGAQYSFEYDSFGSVENMLLPNGGIMRFRHDALGRLTSHVLPLGQQRRIEYDDTGRIVRSIKFDGSDISLSFDDTNRTLDRSVNGTNETYGYDARGSIVSYVSENHSASMSFDGLGRLVRWDDTSGLDTRYTRDGSGHLISITTPRGVTASSYDVATRRQSITFSGRETVIDRNGLGIPTAQQLPEGLAAAHVYDGAGRAVRLSYQQQGSVLREADYTFDNSGRIERKVLSDGSAVDYQYGQDGKLVRETLTDGGAIVRDTDYVYDGNGNMTRRTIDGDTTDYTYDTNDRLISAGAASFSWDANGNLLAHDENGVAEQFSYDTQDRLVSYVRRGVDPVEINYTYHHDGLLRSRSDNGQMVFYTWDRSLPALPMLLEISDGSGALNTRFFNDGLFVTHSVDASNNVTIYLRDHGGSVTGIVQNGVLTSIRYDAFGRRINTTGTAAEIGYANALTDSDSGLVFMRSRWYDPEYGRFLSADSAAPDPARPKTINRYAYVGGDPVNRFDPNGQSEFTIANRIVTLSIASALIAVTDIAFRVGPEEIQAGGFGIKRILNSEARGPDAKFIPFGVLSANLNAWGIGFTGGGERLQFTSPESKERANYLFFGPSFSIPSSLPGGSIVGGGITLAVIGTSCIYNTPKPENYRGYFVSASVGGSATRSILSKVAKAGVAPGASAFWSPVPTYFVDDQGQVGKSGESRYSFGYRAGLAGTAGRGAGGLGGAFSFAISYYWLWDAWDEGAQAKPCDQ